MWCDGLIVITDYALTEFADCTVHGVSSNETPFSFPFHSTIATLDIYLHMISAPL